MFSAISNFFGAIAAIVGLRRESANRANTPKMQANADARTDEQIKDEAAATVAQHDINKLREDLSE